jgi:hypothetical protein
LLALGDPFEVTSCLRMWHNMLKVFGRLTLLSYTSLSYSLFSSNQYFSLLIDTSQFFSSIKA